MMRNILCPYLHQPIFLLGRFVLNGAYLFRPSNDLLILDLIMYNWGQIKEIDPLVKNIDKHRS
jgi:hypothetical protein